MDNSTEEDRATKSSSLLEASYSSAWQEVNTRIAQRQNALTIYTTLVMGITAALTVATKDNLGFYQGLAFFIPIVSACFALLNIKHDLTIQNLRAYLQDCESRGKFDSGYNSTKEWISKANKIRRLHDLTCAALILASNAAALFAIYHSHSELIGWNSLIQWLCIGVAVGSASCILYWGGGGLKARTITVAVAGVVEKGLVRPLDPAVELSEHSRVIIVASEAQ